MIAMKKSRIKFFGGAICVMLLCVSMASDVSAAINIETVSVGNAGNTNDRWGYGAVDYDYNIGKFEVTAGEYTAFLNAVAATDTYALYFISMDASFNEYGCNIIRSGSWGSYNYSVAADWADRPVNFVNLGSAARFANWLHNGQPASGQDLTTTEDGAYYLNGATSPSELIAISREPDATWVIPTKNEWHKAAYHKNDGVTDNYFGYPTSSNAAPSNDLIDPDPGNNATYFNTPTDFTIGSQYYRTVGGAHENSESPYGTFDQGGNIDEWTQESGRRGGSFLSYGPTGELHAAGDYGREPTNLSRTIGFRVAMVPEPATMSLLCLGVSWSAGTDCTQKETQVKRTL